MNVAPKAKKLDWVKIGFIGLLLLVVGYKYYQSNLAPAVADNQEQEKKFSDGDYKVDFKPEKKSSANTNGKKQGGGYDIKFDPQKKSNGSGGDFKPKGNSNFNQPYLISSGRNNKESPAGLLYTMGGGGEHRTEHVLRHAEDQPNRRGSHGVFDANGDDVFRLLDEAYELVKSKSRQVKPEPPRDGKTAYVVDMKRKIGYKGGQSGKKAGHPKLYKVKLVLAGGNRVITAYPF